MADTMRGYHFTDMGCPDLVNGSNYFYWGVLASNGNMYAYPRLGYTKILKVDTSDAFGATLTTFGGSTVIQPVLSTSDFTFTTNPNGGTGTPNFLGPSYEQSFPIHCPDRDEIWIVYVHWYRQSYFVSGFGTHTQVYFKFSALIFDLISETFSSTNLGLSQFTTDTFVGDTGDTSSFGCAAFSGYDNDTIYVGRGQRNSATLGHNIIKIDCSAQTASIHYGSSTSATGGCVPGLANSSNMYFPSSSGTQSLVTLSKSTDTYTVSNPFSGFVAFAPGAKASNGDMYWAPNTAAGMCRVTSGGTASLQTLGGRLTGSDNKCSGCALGPDDHIYIWPRGTASRRTFYELTPSTMVVEDWFADWWFTSGFGDQPQSGPINDDYNFFFPPGNTNQDQLMVGGFREPSSPAVPAILRPEMHVSESGPHFKYPPGLLEPFILYDMRNYDGDFVLHNEGTAGDIWDLNVWSNAFTQSGTTWRSFGGYQGWRKEDSYLYDHHWGGPWIGLPFTIVIALGPMDNADDNPNSQFISAYMETSFNIPQVWLDAIYDKSVGSSYQDDHYYEHYQFVGLDSYMELDLQDAAWRIGADNPPPWRDDLKGKATILYINPMTGGANVWIDGSIISPQTADYHNTVPGSAETGHTEYWSDLAGDALYDDPFPIGRYFWYGIDFHAEASSGPVSWPVSPKAAIGFAFIRGEPTEEDIAFWTEYFYT